MRTLLIVENTMVDGFGSLEDLFVAEDQLETVKVKYEAYRTEAPEWVNSQLNAVRIEIKTRIAGQLQMRLRNAKVRRSALRTADEKRKDLDIEIEDLEKRLSS